MAWHLQERLLVFIVPLFVKVLVAVRVLLCLLVGLFLVENSLGDRAPDFLFNLFCGSLLP